MDFKDINSFEDLRKAQAYLRQESAICRRELGRELTHGRNRLQSYLLTRLGIPLGLIAGFQLFRSASASGDKSGTASASASEATGTEIPRGQAAEKESAESATTWWSELLAVVMPMIIDFSQRWLHDQVRAYEAATAPESEPPHDRKSE